MLRTAIWCAVALAIGLAGCASQGRPAPLGEVQAGMLLPPGVSTWEERPNERFFVADPIGDPPMPEYPPEYLALDLDERQVCVEIVVHPDGYVTSARHNREVPGCGDEGIEPGFVDNAVETISSWPFFGAQLCRFPEGMEPNDGCEGEGVQIEPVPVRLGYVFSYVQVDGQARVEQVSGEAPGQDIEH